MKKLIAAFVITALIVACNSGDKKTQNDGAAQESKTETGSALSDNPDYKKGLKLIANSDCLTCHKIDDKITGPSYREVADKYKGANDEVIAQLAERIIKGGSGVWGSAIMTPHRDVSEEDAKTMVKYILLLKTQ
jgi:cytochrome c